MAKGRHYDADRLLGTYSYASNQFTGPEYHESDMWSNLIEPESDRSGWAPTQEYRNMGGLSMAFSGVPSSSERRRQPERQYVVAASAPVNVPDWTRFRQEDSVEPVSESENEWGSTNNGEAGEWVPPHVYLARTHGIGVASSVFEGVGRTLKGRDMSRVRDAVWNQTGFFG
jgi:Senescence regulator